MSADRQIPGDWRGFGFTEIRDSLYPPPEVETKSPAIREQVDYYDRILRRVMESSVGAVELIFHEDPEFGFGSPTMDQLSAVSENLRERALKLKQNIGTIITEASGDSEAKILVYLPK